jgi:hypothetical protein
MINMRRPVSILEGVSPWASVTRAAAIVCALAPVAAAFAQPEVSLDVASRQLYVNTPIFLQLRVSNFKRCDAPQMPSVDGCDLRSQGSSDEIRQEFNGRRNVMNRSRTFNYALIATEPGEIVIPPVTVRVDGKDYETKQLRLVVRDVPESPAPSASTLDSDDDTSRLLLAEITCEQKRLFAGQRADFLLTIWIKPAAYGGRELGESDMLRFLSGSFGPFDVNDVKTDRVPLRDPDGGVERYYAVSLPAEFIVDQAGPVDFSEVSVGAKYPLRFRRSIFGDLTATQYKQLQIKPKVSVPEALPLPTENRPANFSGAVGQYRMSLIAVPTNVRVGDPIDLTITITGDPVESLRQPDLSKVPGLTDDFRIAESDLAGTVSGNDKRFKQTIRAKRPDVKDIPPLEFSYFDPIREQYEVARTEPVPLLVRPVERLDASDLGQIAVESEKTPASKLEVRDGLRGLKTNESELLAAVPSITSAQVWTVTLAGPLVFCAAWAGVTLVSRKRSEAAQRKRRALRHAEQRIREARQGDGAAGDFHGRIESAMAGYLADRLNQPPAHFLGSDALSLLSERGVNADLAASYADVMRRCQEAAYAGGGDGVNSALADAALACLQQLEKERL